MPQLPVRIHGVLDYAVAAVLILAPLALGFAATSVASAVVSIAAGVGLLGYSLLTDYGLSFRRAIPWRVHLLLDAAAGVALVAAPFVLGFDGVPRSFLIAVGVADLVVAAISRRDPDEAFEKAVAEAA